MGWTFDFSLIKGIFFYCPFQFPNMSPYIRFCSQQLNAAALIQRLHENAPEFRELLKQCQSHPKVKGFLFLFHAILFTLSFLISWIFQYKHWEKLRNYLDIN